MASIELSRRCIPWTPFRGSLAATRVCLVSSAAVRAAGDEPFAPDDDIGFRVIESTTTGADLVCDDTHFDHACIDQDINCVFPLDRLRELADEGVIAGLTEHHYSFGFTMRLRQLRDETMPEIVSRIERLRPQAVVLTGG